MQSNLMPLSLTPLPQIQPTPLPQIQPTPLPQIQPTPLSLVQPTPLPQIQPTPLPQIQPTPLSLVQPTPTPILVGVSYPPETQSTVVPSSEIEFQIEPEEDEPKIILSIPRPTFNPEVTIPIAPTQKRKKFKIERIPEAKNWSDIPRDRFRSPIVRHKTKQNPKLMIFYRVVNNILEILEKRGYTIPSKFSDIKGKSMTEFIATYRNKAESSDMTVRQYLSENFFRDDPVNPGVIYVIYPETIKDKGSTSKDQLQELNLMLTKQLNSTDPRNPTIRHVMIVSENPLSSQGKASLKEYPAIKFELFTYNEISFLSSYHFLVPRHRRLDPKEIEQLLQGGILISELKTIAKDDPIVREYGFTVGDVIEITRVNYLYLHPIITTIEYRTISRKPMVPK